MVAAGGPRHVDRRIGGERDRIAHQRQGRRDDPVLTISKPVKLPYRWLTPWTVTVCVLPVSPVATT